MPEIKVFGTAGEAGDSLVLDDDIFGVEVREDLVHAAVVAQLAAKRLGTRKAKSRGEVRGGGRKPYRQKGTGRARQGSTRAPQWKGGGVVFPPLPGDFRQRLPRRVKRAALCSCWSDHVAGETLLVVEGFAAEGLKTSAAVAALENLLRPLAEQLATATPAPPERPEGDTRPVRRVRLRRHLLLLIEASEVALQRALRNVAEIRFTFDHKVNVTYRAVLGTAPYASVYDLALADVVIATKGALARVEAEFVPSESEEEDSE